MFAFQHTGYLFGLALIPLLLLLFNYLVRWKKNTVKRIGDERLIKELTSDYSPRKFRIKFIFFILAFTLLVIALANPRLPNNSTVVKHNGIDVMIALDVSKSMLAHDISPNRLERAKQVIAKLIDRLENNRIGIVVFAGRAYLQMPLTGDLSAAKMFLSTATPDIVPTQGTVISDALKMCNASFNSAEKKYKSILLISDGEDHDGKAVKIAQSLAGDGVMINTIGIGSPEGALIIDELTNETKKDESGNPIVTKLNEEILKEIALNGNGIYQHYSNTDDVVMNIEKQLQGMGQHVIRENSSVNYSNYFQWFLGAAFFLLLAELFISEKRNKKKWGLSKTVPLTLFFLGTTIFVHAQSGEELIQKGNAAYNKKEYSHAEESYRKAASISNQKDKAAYNLGNALYRNGKTDSAINAYDAAIQNSLLPAEKSASWYNKGVVQQNNKQLEACIESYKHSLRLNPNDDDARQNLQRALQQKKQQEQKKQQKDQPKKQEKENQQEKDKKNKQEDKSKDEAPKPSESKMSPEEAEERLKTIAEHEKNLQEKLKKVNAASPEKPEKDW